MERTDRLSDDEACWWISEHEETDRELNIPIRVQYICVMRDTEPALFVWPIGTCEQLGRKGFPPAMAYGFGEQSVGRTRELINEVQDTYKPSLIQPIVLTVGGEDVIVPDGHPITEVMENGNNGLFVPA